MQCQQGVARVVVHEVLVSADYLVSHHELIATFNIERDKKINIYDMKQQATILYVVASVGYSIHDDVLLGVGWR